MAGYKGHVVGAVVVNAAYVGVLEVVPSDALLHTRGLLSEWQMLMGLFVIAVLFGLFPDIDTNSKGQNIFYGLALVADIALILSGRLEAAAYLGLLAMLPIVGHHRGWTHSFWAMLLIPAPIAALMYLYDSRMLTAALLIYGASVAGYFSHLLLDGKVIRGFAIHSKRQ